MDALNGLLDPVRPTLQLVTHNIPSPLVSLSYSLIGPACHNTIIRDLDFSSGNEVCIKLAISKALGIGIVAASSIVKVPQLIKLLNSQSAVGVSFLSYVLETAAYTITLAYSVRHGFPFSTYGETALIAVQDIAITILILVFSGRSAFASVFVALFAVAAYALFNSKLVNMTMLGYLQGGAGLLGVISKVPQIYTIYQEGGTGQLSAFAVFNYLLGSVARIFTTLQEVNDNLILYGYISGFALNLVLAAQMLYYWNSPAKGAPALSTTAKRQEMAVGVTSGVSPSIKSKGPSTRRRG